MRRASARRAGSMNMPDRPWAWPRQRTCKGGLGLAIRYAPRPTASSATVLAGFTDQGVCSIEFGDARDDLVQALRERFPKADLRDAQDELAPLLQEVAAFVHHPARGLDLPLDIQGTAFQQRVWQELVRIPAGQTRTYSDVARALGKPKGRPRRGSGLCEQSAGRGRALPSRPAQIRRAGRLPLGLGTETATA